MERQETSRFAKWAEDLAHLLDYNLQKRGLYYTEKGVISRRKKQKPDDIWHRFSTQTIRRNIVRGLGRLYRTSIEFVENTELSLREREKWARLAVYMAQTINTINLGRQKFLVDTRVHDQGLV